MSDLVTPNVENIKMLVGVLRTTDLPQTQGYLNVVSTECECSDRTPVGMCCLGVACEQVPGLAKKIVQRKCSFCEASLAVVSYGADVEQVGVLPVEAQDFYEFFSIPQVWYKGRDEDVTTLNDKYGVPFKEIGDAFARTYLGENV